MTDFNLLDAWQELCDAATEGPWILTAEEPHGIACLMAPNDSLLMLDRDGMACVDKPEDARFIAAARTAMPVLLDEVRRLRAELDDCRTSSKRSFWSMLSKEP